MVTNKKIAYIFHGHSRTWDKCHKNFFNNVYSILPGDIFIHTWDRVNAANGSWWGPHGFSNQLHNDQYAISSQLADIKGISETYKPAMLVVEQDRSYKPLDYSPIANTNHIMTQGTPAFLGTKCMLYQSRLAFCLAQSHSDYDYFFSTRLDIDYPEKLSEQEVAGLLCSDKLSIVSGDNVPDVWMFGPAHLMDIKTQYVDHIDNYWFQRHPDLHAYGYEMALRDYIEDANVPLRVTNFPYKIQRLF